MPGHNGSSDRHDLRPSVASSPSGPPAGSKKEIVLIVVEQLGILQLQPDIVWRGVERGKGDSGFAGTWDAQ